MLVFMHTDREEKRKLYTLAIHQHFLYQALISSAPAFFSSLFLTSGAAVTGTVQAYTVTLTLAQ